MCWYILAPVGRRFFQQKPSKYFPRRIAFLRVCRKFKEVGIPSHCGIPANEKAKSLEAARDPEILSPNQSLRGAHAIILDNVLPDHPNNNEAQGAAPNPYPSNAEKGCCQSPLPRHCVGYVHKIYCTPILEI